MSSVEQTNFSSDFQLIFFRTTFNLIWEINDSSCSRNLILLCTAEESCFWIFRAWVYVGKSYFIKRWQNELFVIDRWNFDINCGREYNLYSHKSRVKFGCVHRVVNISLNDFSCNHIYRHIWSQIKLPN